MHHNARLLLVTATTLVAVSLSAQSVGDLTVTPTRVVFEGRTRSAQLDLIHRGTATATYRISFVEMRMHEDGRFEEIDPANEGESFAAPLVRYFPRQVTLEPGVAQTVRLALRKPAELEAGEYRSHLVLRAVPAATASTGIETRDLEGDEFAIRLTPIYGVSIPVIVRHGALDAQVRISEAALEPATTATDTASVRLRLERTGKRSAYGDVRVTFVPDDGAAETVVGEVKGLAIYVPNPVRTLHLPLYLPEGLGLEHGRLRVQFEEEAREGKEKVEAWLRLPPPRVQSTRITRP